MLKKSRPHTCGLHNSTHRGSPLCYSQRVSTCPILPCNCVYKKKKQHYRSYFQLWIAEYREHGTGIVRVFLFKWYVHPSHNGKVCKGESVLFPGPYFISIFHPELQFKVFLLPIQTAYKFKYFMEFLHVYQNLQPFPNSSLGELLWSEVTAPRLLYLTLFIPFLLLPLPHFVFSPATLIVFLTFSVFLWFRQFSLHFCSGYKRNWKNEANNDKPGKLILAIFCMLFDQK